MYLLNYVALMLFYFVQNLKIPDRLIVKVFIFSNSRFDPLLIYFLYHGNHRFLEYKY
jgi:hypothetical protein